MTHQNELWQEFAQNGERLDTNGYDSTLSNPKRDFSAPLVNTINVWLYRYTDYGIEVLFQKRSPLVDRHPNSWDISFGGHINHQEPILAAVAREAKEEIGIAIDSNKLEYVVSFVADKVNLIVTEYVYDYTGQPESFQFDDQEVSAVKWVPLAELEDFIKQYGKKPLRKGWAYIYIKQLLEMKSLLASASADHKDASTS